MKYLYKYPQAEYPYRRLLEENQRRTKVETEYDLVDTGIFDQARYFDVVVEYAKLNAEDLLVRISVTNRGPRRHRSTCCRLSGSAIPGAGGATIAGRP
jgi:hypothetical protein